MALIIISEDKTKKKLKKLRRKFSGAFIKYAKTYFYKMAISASTSSSLVAQLVANRTTVCVSS